MTTVGTKSRSKSYHIFIILGISTESFSPFFQLQKEVVLNLENKELNRNTTRIRERKRKSETLR